MAGPPAQTTTVKPPKGKPIVPDTLEPSKGPVTALQVKEPPRTARTLSNLFRTPERVSRSSGLGRQWGEFMHGATEGGYNPDNHATANRLFEHAKTDLLVEQAKVDPYWKQLNAVEREAVLDVLENDLPLNSIPSVSVRTAAERLLSYRDWVEKTTGAQFGGIPRGEGPWDVTVSPPLEGYPDQSFPFERQALEYADMLETIAPTAKVEVQGPIDTRTQEVPYTDPSQPRIKITGKFPEHISPVDGITQAAEKILRQQFEESIQGPLDALRKEAQTNATVGGLYRKAGHPGGEGMTPAEFANYDNDLRRAVYGTTGMARLRKSVEPLNAAMRQGINRAAEEMGASGDIVVNPVGGIADAMLTIQHFMQLTSGSENFNRVAEFYVQTVTETHDPTTAAKIQAMQLTRQGRRWSTALQDVYAAGQPIVDPRVSDPAISGTGKALSKVQGVVLAGHRAGTNEGIQLAADASYEYYVNHGKTPDLLLTNKTESIGRAFPQLTQREAFNRVLTETERIENRAWKESQENPDGASYDQLKRQMTLDYLTRDIADGGLELTPDQYVYPENGDWTGINLHMEDLVGKEMIPLGGHLIAGSHMFLIRTAYLRWPGHQLNVETYAPNLSRYGMPYLNPSMRNAQHVYDMHMQLIHGKETQIDPGMREALLQQSMAVAAAQRYLPAATWWTNRTLMAGGRLPLNAYNMAARVAGQDEVDLQDLVNELGPERAYLVYFGGLAALGINFTGADQGVIPGERSSDILGMRPDEQHAGIAWDIAEYIYNQSIGNALPVALAEAAIRTSESQNKTLAIGQQFGAGGGLMKGYRGLTGQYAKDSRGLNPLERKFQPPTSRETGMKMPDAGPWDGTLPLAQRFSDLTPAQRVFWLQLADEAVARLDAMEATTEQREDTIRRAKETEDRLAGRYTDSSTGLKVTGEGRVRASDLEWLLPKSEKKEVVGYRAVDTTAFTERERNIRNREPYPLDPIEDLGNVPGWIMNSRTKFERNVASSAKKAAQDYMEGKQPDLGYGPKGLPKARKPDEVVVRMDRQQAINQAIGFLTEHAYGPGGLPHDYLKRIEPMDEYGQQHSIVHKYADLIMREYNNVINRSPLAK